MRSPKPWPEIRRAPISSRMWRTCAGTWGGGTEIEISAATRLSLLFYRGAPARTPALLHDCGSGRPSRAAPHRRRSRADARGDASLLSLADARGGGDARVRGEAARAV